DKTSGLGPILSYGGQPVLDGSRGTWQPIVAEKWGPGYEVAWKDATSGEYKVWAVTNDGNYFAGDDVVMSGSEIGWYEDNVFHQDLNGDGHIGFVSFAAAMTSESGGPTSDTPTASASLGFDAQSLFTVSDSTRNANHAG